MILKNDDKNKAVITTKDIMNGTEDIKYILYDDEGDWQFLTGDDEISEDDAAVVSISEILQIDATLLYLPEIEEDEVLIRETKNSAWQKI
jgi:capsid portal protein